MKLLPALLAALTFVGCATGPSFADYQTTVQPVAQDMGRIWFYRPSKMIGAAVQPMVRINDTPVAKAQPGSYFYADRAPGEYKISCSTEWTHKKMLQLGAREEKYVRLTMAPGLVVGHVIPSIVDAEKGLREIAKCKHYTAKK
jgi:hypothetical protein